VQQGVQEETLHAAEGSRRNFVRSRGLEGILNKAEGL
jgi:hypothetical protein